MAGSLIVETWGSRLSVRLLLGRCQFLKQLDLGHPKAFISLLVGRTKVQLVAG